MRFGVATVAVALAVQAGAAERPLTSERFAYSTFRETSGRVSVLVDGYPASLHTSDGFVPIPIAVVSSGPGRSVAVSPEVFTLADAAGNFVPAVSYGDLVKRYGKIGYDRAMIRQRPSLGSYAASLFRVEGTFYPPPGTTTRTGRIEVPPFAYFRGVVYFPMPAGGLRGVLTLRMERSEGAPIEVRFVAAPEDLESR